MKNEADKRARETEGTRPRMIDRRDKKHKKGMKGGRHGLDNYSNTTFTVYVFHPKLIILITHNSFSFPLFS